MPYTIETFSQRLGSGIIRKKMPLKETSFSSNLPKATRLPATRNKQPWILCACCNFLKFLFLDVVVVIVVTVCIPKVLNFACVWSMPPPLNTCHPLTPWQYACSHVSARIEFRTISNKCCMYLHTYVCAYVCMCVCLCVCL